MKMLSFVYAKSTTLSVLKVLAVIIVGYLYFEMPKRNISPYHWSHSLRIGNRLPSQSILLLFSLPFPVFSSYSSALR